MRYNEGMSLGLEYFVIALLVILFSMTLHEAMHAYVGYWLGDDTAKQNGRLTLNPLAHIDPYLTLFLPLMIIITSVISGVALPVFGGAKPVPFNPNMVRYGEFGAALVGVSGPLCNLFIAFLAFGSYAFFSPVGIAANILSVTVMINLGFFVFNMIPIPPLDGSRVLYALAPERARSVMDIIEKNGLIFVFAIVLIFGQQIGGLINYVSSAVLGIFATLFGVKVV